MKTTDFNFELPESSIAQAPVEPRDHSKLMVVHKGAQLVEHKHFFDLLDYLQAGDVIVWNNSKVFKARLHGELLSQTGEILRDHTKPMELFLIRPFENSGMWQALARPGRHAKNGTRIQIAPDFYCDVVTKEKEGTLLVQFPDDEQTVRAKANQYGSVPTPPYVKDERHQLDVYQTVYAKHEGSVAAPTAGFHFTPELIQAIKQKGVEFAEVTLHVGLGTFLPIKTELVEDHTMHSEQVEISAQAAQLIMTAKQAGRRIIAVGTTTTRTLEGVALQSGEAHTLKAYTGDINIFIKPGFQFQIVDVLITNLHLPKSTLLMLVSAFAQDRQFILDCYKQAVEHQYRFYSFGDAMVIL